MKAMLDMLNSFAFKYDKFQLFQDFCEMSAIAIHNSLRRCPKKEERFLATKSRYTDEEYAKFQHLFQLLTEALEAEPGDVIGSVFMTLGLSDKKRKGQCYTPNSLSTLCGQLALMDTATINEQIRKHGYYRYYEPCIGAGSLVIGFCKHFKEMGHNPQRELLVVGQDIDLKAVQMSYVQLSLLGIPAVIEHADPLTKEVFDSWGTPFYYFQQAKFIKEIQ